MAALTIDPELGNILRSRAEAEGVTVDRYLERLLREEDAEIAHTEALLQEAADSGDSIEMTEDEWDRIEREAVAEAKSKRAAFGFGDDGLVAPGTFVPDFMGGHACRGLTTNYLCKE